eukprot:6205837-Pleurochrysis_carterae.AAC.1
MLFGLRCMPSDRSGRANAKLAQRSVCMSAMELMASRKRFWKVLQRTRWQTHKQERKERKPALILKIGGLTIVDISIQQERLVTCGHLYTAGAFSNVQDVRIHANKNVQTSKYFLCLHA